ncbi:unnamed protein product [Ostreobium quekettii]|uniref:Aminoacyl-transfer RNA synthetases class-II family profile domain-containing protein n=1 Tax=Ostreobium quekettii TaxID=121088 RepID=A0A8S1IM23_9CHLO|nr:unnamed protein product [Ostreobium quekettii]|eukprot:evm.model.scf_237.7 EVM.evm.TU.scf_237.7   scf_237:45445-47520(+)
MAACGRVFCRVSHSRLSAFRSGVHFTGSQSGYHSRPDRDSGGCGCLQWFGTRALSSGVETEEKANGGDGLPSSPAQPSGDALLPLNAQLEWPQPTHACGALREAQAGQRVKICGWVDAYRNFGSIVFLDIRDQSGLLQVVSEPGPVDTSTIASRLRKEYVVCVLGTVRVRKDPNPLLATGKVEVLAEAIVVLNAIQRKLPFPVSSAEETEAPREELRLRHRVLDLRRPAMASNIRLRHHLVKAIRRFLEDQADFVEVETPVLTRSTPEGARDYLVPARNKRGEWYALPQSPQLFKQMLMVAGFNRYYQIAKCFRDEDLRADRQPEFTQLDMELAFTDSEGIMNLVEDLMSTVFWQVKGTKLQKPFPRLTYSDALSRYGTDRPDTRFEMKLADVSSAVADSSFLLFSNCIAAGGVVKALRVPKGLRITNSRLKTKGDVSAEAVKCGAKGVVYIRVQEGGQINAAKNVVEGLSQEQKEELLRLCEAQPEDLLLLVATSSVQLANNVLSHLRLYLAKELGEISEDAHALVWVTDFPMFEWNEGDQRWESLHHPFTAPNPGTIAEDGDLTGAKALAYDLVYNGIEIGGGSMRIFKRALQMQVFKTIGLSEEEAVEKFGFLLDCFDLGAPPHGGIAFGVDRLAMLMAGANSIRDVIAFPKTTQAECLLTGAPAPVKFGQLDELGVRIQPKDSDSES